MAEFLLSNRDTSAAGGCAIGDIRDVRPDGWGWSDAELPNVVKLPAVAYDEKYKLCDQREYVKPIRGRHGKYYDLTKMNAGLEIPDILVEIKNTEDVDVFESDVKTATMKPIGRELVKDRGDAVTKEVVLKFGSVVLDIIDDQAIVNKRRYHIVGKTIVDKTA